MFSAHLRRLYRTCDRVIIRNIRNRRLDPGPNPGLNKRVAAFKQDGVKIIDDDVEEFVERSESDFYNVDIAYNEHLNETMMGKHELRHQIIKEKYFKENMPSLLTWSEKEQIRHLATTEPDEWTPEKIAESFPITVPIVKKLLKYPWKPATEQRIARHDASVMRNWRELKEGSLDIPEDLRQHFLKFSERKIPPLSKKSIKIDLTQEHKLGEFEKIIQRCASKENSNSSSDKAYSEDINEQQTSKDSKPKKKDVKMVTLDELTEKIKQRIEKGKEVNMPDKIIYDTVKATVPNAPVKEYPSEIELTQEDTSTGIVEYSDPNKLTVMDYPERIRIPKKAYKKGATYKVKDCYYDHDGRFLYRVIGMTN